MTYQIGDPNHLGVHNDLVASVRTAAQRAGVTVTLPDEAHLGDTGHVADHNLLAAALAEIAAAGGGMTWARVSGGTVTTVNNPDGSVDEVHTFTADGTLTVESPGYARVLLVGAGAASANPDNAGRVLEGIYPLPAGPLAVGVGPQTGIDGLGSYLGTALVTGYASAAANAASATSAGLDPSAPGKATSYFSDITGTRLAYANRTNGGRPGDSANAGVVIVRVQKSAPTVSGVAATGGTVTEFVGDGTNGVAGQRYRVHTFTANGTLTVSQGGPADVFVVSGGAGLFTGGQGGSGGQVWEGRVTLGPVALPVTVGAGGQQSAGITATRSQGSSLGTVAVTGPVSAAEIGAGSGSGAITLNGITRSYDGTPKVYGSVSSGTPRANSGDGSSNAANGAAGVVIVRYEIA